MGEVMTLESCIDACRRCARECQDVVTRHPCVTAPDRRCVHAALDCAELSSLVADFLERASPAHGLMAVLSKLCHQCCHDCRHCEGEHCARCAAACEHCAAECDTFSEEVQARVGSARLGRGL